MDHGKAIRLKGMKPLGVIFKAFQYGSSLSSTSLDLS